MEKFSSNGESFPRYRIQEYAIKLANDDELTLEHKEDVIKSIVESVINITYSSGFKIDKLFITVNDEDETYYTIGTEPLIFN